MRKKYEILESDFKSVDNYTVHRIRAVRGFGFVSAGELGGYIEGDWNLSHTGHCWVFNKACVFGRATVDENALVRRMAQVYDDASLRGDVLVYDNAKVYGRAIICDDAMVLENARVFDAARVMKHAIITENAHAYGQAILTDNVRVGGSVRAFRNARLGNSQCFRGNLEIDTDWYQESPPRPEVSSPSAVTTQHSSRRPRPRGT